MGKPPLLAGGAGLVRSAIHQQPAQLSVGRYLGKRARCRGLGPKTLSTAKSASNFVDGSGFLGAVRMRRRSS
jgi:hypothetical protein